MMIITKSGMEMFMKKQLNQTTLTAMAAGVGLLLCLSMSASAGTTNEWLFKTSANSVSPLGSGSGGIATIAPGAYSSGWLGQNDVFGSAKGVWDLGRSGTITLNSPSGLAGTSGQVRVFTVKVVEWNDGGIYDEPTKVSVPGAKCISTNIDAAAAANLNSTTSVGEWIVNETQWRAEAGTPVNSAVITSANLGSVVNQVVVESSATIITKPSPQLTIQLIGSAGNQQAMISWPTNLGSKVLESTSNLNDPQSWTPVQADVQTAGNVNSVTVGTGDAMRFYRLE
jgi:hypothetical protein